MKRMRVVAQTQTVEQALFALNTVLSNFLMQKGNEIYGTVYFHDGSTDQGIKAPWGETEEEVDVEANSSFTADGDDSFIDLMFGTGEVGAIYGIQAGEGEVEFILDMGSDEATVGNTGMPLESVATAIRDQIEESDLPDDHAAEKLEGVWEAAQADKWDSQRDEY